MAAQQRNSGAQTGATPYVNILSELTLAQMQRRRTATDAVQIGKQLFILKNETSHGDFIPLLQKIGFDRTVTLRFMRCASMFANVSSTRHLLEAAGTQSKLFELLRLSNNELKLLSDGETVRGLNIASIAAKSTRDIREMLRSSSWENAIESEAITRAGSASAMPRNAISAGPLHPAVDSITGGASEAKQDSNSAEARPSESASKANSNSLFAAVSNSPEAHPSEGASNAHGATAEFQSAEREFSDGIYSLTNRAHRAGAMVRLLRHQLRNPHGDESLCEEDILQVVDMLAETLPHHYDEVSDPLSAYETVARREVKRAWTYGENLNKILEAMTIVARGDTTIDDINEALDAVLTIARNDPAYEPDWRTLVEVLNSRGFTVKTEEHRGVMMMPRAITPSTAKKEAKMSRAVSRLVKTCLETSGGGIQGAARVQP